MRLCVRVSQPDQSSCVVASGTIPLFVFCDGARALIFCPALRWHEHPREISGKRRKSAGRTAPTFVLRIQKRREAALSTRGVSGKVHRAMCRASPRTPARPAALPQLAATREDIRGVAGQFLQAQAVAAVLGGPTAIERQAAEEDSKE